MENNSLNPSQQPSQVSQSSPHFSKTFIILMILLLVAIFGVGGYILGASQNKIVQTKPVVQTLQPSPSPVDETANWKTYTSEDGTFSFKYPSDWAYEKKGSEIRYQNKNYKTTSIIFGAVSTKNHIGQDIEPYIQNIFSIEYATNSEFNSIDPEDFPIEWCSTELAGEEITEVKVDALTAIRRVTGCGPAGTMFVYFKNKSTLYITSSESIHPSSKIHDQILSTFKFTQ